MEIRDIIGKGFVLLDGAMGTQIQELGIPFSRCPEELNLTEPQAVTAIHMRYVNAGAEVVYTNTFQANANKLPKSLNLEEVISAAINNARRSGTKFVALDVGPTGSLIEPMGEMSFERAYEIFKEVVICGDKHGADLIVFETFSSLYEMRAALLAAKENSKLPVFCTMSYEGARTISGTTVASEMLTLTALGADAVGFNCSVGPTEMLPLVKEAVKWTTLPIIVKPNAGLPNGKTFNADEYAKGVSDLIDAGATIVGGCCGTTPEYIERLKNVLKSKKYAKRSVIVPDAVCSEKRVVRLDGLKVVGERINPTGKKLFKAALLSGDLAYADREALAQKNAGADLLDVNCGLPELDEPKVLPQLIKRVQGELPLMIDTSDPTALEAALRVYNGVPIVNSVNGDEESIKNVLPLVKKYGAFVIALCLDGTGIKSGVTERTAIADKIIAAGKTYGIPENRFIADTLTLSVATGKNNAADCLSALRALSARGIKTALGISNISFGLPNRANINAAFLSAAISAGLTLAIINPLVKEMKESADAGKLLNGGSVEEYVALYSGAEKPVVTAQTELTLEYCIMNGLKEGAAKATAECLKTESPSDIIDKKLTVALDVVGKEYEAGRFFLPELVAAVEAAKAAFDVIKEALSGEKVESKGKVVLATVKGDIHDIGKNIVKAVIENYGFEVIDLGRDVLPQTVVETAIREKVLLVGLSALMTTTAKAMAETVALLKESEYKGKVMVGGAVITQEYADKIGADYYSKDAASAAKIAKKVYGAE